MDASRSRGRVAAAAERALAFLVVVGAARAWPPLSSCARRRRPPHFSKAASRSRNPCSSAAIASSTSGSRRVFAPSSPAGRRAWPCRARRPCRRVAERRRVAFRVQYVVGDLEGRAERRAIARQRLRLVRARLAEDRAGVDGEAQQRAGLHRLQGQDFVLGQRTSGGFGLKIERLTADHAAKARGARQSQHELRAHLRDCVRRGSAITSKA